MNGVLLVAASGALAIGLNALAATIVVLVLCVVAGRAARVGRDRRRARLVAETRPDVIRLADAQDTAALDRLVRLDARHWKAVQPVAASLLRTVSGESRSALIELFARRGTADQALQELHGRSVVKRARAAETLGDLGHRPAVGALCGLLGDHDEAVRLVAARSLGRIGDAAAARPLIDLLASGRGVPEHIVAQALMRLGPAAVPALAEGAVDPDARARAIAVETLGRLGGYDAIGAVTAALEGDASVAVRVHAAQALGRLGLPSATGPLLEATHGDETPLRVAALRGLRALAAPAAVPRLRELLADPVPQVANEAARSLLGLGGLGRAVLEEEAAAAGQVEPGRSAIPFGPSGSAAAVARQVLAAEAVRPRLRPAAGRRG